MQINKRWIVVLFLFAAIKSFAIPRWWPPKGGMPRAKAHVAYTYDLTKNVTSTKPPVEYRMRTGPAWVTITKDGQLTGTPTGRDVGWNWVGLTLLDDSPYMWIDGFWIKVEED